MVTVDCFCTTVLREDSVSNLQNGEVEVRAVICKKGMTPKEIHEDSMKTLRNESLSYITVKKWAAEFKRERERERALRMM